MGQTVNLLSFDFGGSNPSAPTVNLEINTNYSYLSPFCVH